MDEKGIKIDEEDVDDAEGEGDAQSAAGAAADKSETGGGLKVDGKADGGSKNETMHTNKSIDGQRSATKMRSA